MDTGLVVSVDVVWREGLDCRNRPFVPRMLYVRPAHGCEGEKWNIVDRSWHRSQLLPACRLQLRTPD